MKIWLITLPLLFAAGIALADGMESEQPADQSDNAMAPTDIHKTSSARHHEWKPKRLPRGDLRHCLELKDNQAIIRCAETTRKN